MSVEIAFFMGAKSHRH